MRSSMLAFALITLFAGVIHAQSYHDQKFIAGWRSLYVYDAGTAAVSSLVPTFASTGHRMDADNRCIVFADAFGLYRFDPTSSQTPLTTIALLPRSLWYMDRFVVNQDGDYIVSVHRSGTPNVGHQVLKITPAGVMQTIYSASFPGAQIRNGDHVGIDIDTGHYLVTQNAGIGNHPVLRLTDQGVVTTWNTGRGTIKRGWDGEHNLCQNHRNGFLEAPEMQQIYQLRPGTSAPTTIATLPQNMLALYGSCAFDLQTAARPRWLMPSTNAAMTGTFIYTIDRSTFAVTSMMVDPSRWIFNMDLAFLRGRHIQTVKTAPRKWDIRLSCPRLPFKRYVLVAGVSGVRPGVPLPDGRRINVVPDDLVRATLDRRIPTVFHQGSGVLNGAGEAIGKLDLSSIGSPGIPLWLAMVVLDPTAPSGIAYLPDTYVMRI